MREKCGCRPTNYKKSGLKGKNNLQSKPKDDRINLCNSIRVLSVQLQQEEGLAAQ